LNDVPNDGNLFIFDECPPISTYIYSLAVGPYFEFENTSGFKVPMKIMCRQTKQKLAFAEDKFKLIEESILFFE
jgi:aminopeptidase N